MKIDSVTLYQYRIPLKVPFHISVGQLTEKEGILVELKSGELSGWGEAAVDGIPFYTQETVGTFRDIVQKIFAPMLKSRVWNHPGEFIEASECFRGNSFAKTGVETALWDLYGKIQGRSLAEMICEGIDGRRQWVETGPSLGIKGSPDELVDEVGEVLNQGYRRVKVKVKPGRDVKYLEAIRNAYPEATIMVDANAAYTVEDIDDIAVWDRFNLLMIEQPLNHDDVYFHAALRKKCKTPICLDESIATEHLCRCAVESGAMDILNNKVCRVGGLVKTRKIHDYLVENNLPMWIGARIDGGVADAARLAAASMPNCKFATDATAAELYLENNLLQEPWKKRDGCEVFVPDGPGLGIEIDQDKLRHYLEASILCE